MVVENLIPNTEIYLQLLRFFVSLGIGLFVTRTVLMPLSRKLAQKKGGDKKMVHSTENIAAITGIFMTFTVALQAASFGNLVTVLGAVAAAATVAIGFGMRDQVSSVVAGIFIYTDNPFVKGDYIKVNETEGVVKDISLRATILNGGESEKQIVPNSILTQNTVKNFTKGRKTKVSIKTDVDVDKTEEVSRILLEKIENTSETLNKPAPKTIFKHFSDGKMELDTVFWIKDSKDVKDVRSEVLKEFNTEIREKKLFDDDDS